MSSGRQVDPLPVRNARAEEGESDATLQGLDELEAPNPVPTHEAGPSLEHSQSISEPGVGRLDELAVPSPLKNGPASSRHSQDLEGAIRRESHQQHEARESSAKPSSAAAKINLPKIYIHSYLVFFSILGTLARLGLQAITIYPGAPVALGEIWANVAGTLVMGFLAEDRTLFQRDLAITTQRFQKRHDASSSNSNGGGSSSNGAQSPNKPDIQALDQLQKEHMAIKKTIPLYIGLSVGFCGSFTTFSSFMRDAFLALSNDLNTAPTSTKTTTPTPRPRNAGYSLAAVLVVLILVVAASLAALSFGAHLALLSEHIITQPRAEKQQRRNTRRRSLRTLLDPLIAVLTWPLWLGAVFMAIWPPQHGHAVSWRGQAVFALVFAPAGCLLRFYLAQWLNARVARFPVGTFAANVVGTVVLGMCYDLQHSKVGSGGVIGCQVLQGVMDGFCGCLTTSLAPMDELSSVFRASSSPRTRRRAITSCDTCRRRKVKCDRNHPICSACRTAGRPCLYNESSVRQLGIHAAAPPPGSSRRRGVRNDSPSTTTTTTATTSGVQRRQRSSTSARWSPTSYDGIDTRLERLESLLERVIHASSTAAAAAPPSASHRTPVPVAQQQQQQLEEAVDSQQNSRHVSTRASPEQPSPAAEPIRAEKDDDGTLLLGQGGSQFVSSHHWSLLATELQDIREILSTDKEPSTPDVFAAAGGHIAQFLPSDTAACYDLLRIFYLYIDPITRVVHKPSLDKRFALFVQEYVNPRWPALDGSEEHLEEKLSHDGLLQFRSLAFAIFYTAAHSQAVASGYAEEKRREMATYRKGLELSLLAADFCGSSSLEVLQAYVLLLVRLSLSLLSLFHPPAIALPPLSSLAPPFPHPSPRRRPTVATRMAIAQGLHREPTLFSPIPSEVAVELRRRIWHQLCYLEWRAAELKGMVSLSAAVQQIDDALTTRVPMNVDDEELSELRQGPGLLDARRMMEVERGRFTDTTFLVGRSRWVQCAKVVAANVQGLFRRTKGGTASGGGGGGAVAADEAQVGGDAEKFAEFEKLHRETGALVDRTREQNATLFRFLYDDPTPLQKLCVMTSRSMEWKCWLTFWCSVPKDFRKKVMTDDARRRVLHESVSLLESLNTTTADPTIQGFKWFLEAHSAFQCTFLVLSELQELRFTSPELDGAIRSRAIEALKQLVRLHDGDGGGGGAGGPQGSSSSRPWAVIKKYIERLERPAVAEAAEGQGGVDVGAGAGAGPMDGVVLQDTSAVAAAALDAGMIGGGGGFDDSPSSMMVLPQPFATEEELLQFTFPPGTEWTDPMQDFSLWHVQ
ncbi:putative chromosome condensation protein [Lasiodiplodia theobromae]|nr:putative chromosome condensation protein [Lasiodiplodia theobromae]